MDCFDVLIYVDDYEVGRHVADAHAQYVTLMARKYDFDRDKDNYLTDDVDDADYPF